MNSPEGLPSVEPGTVIAERYAIERKLGEGGMGQIYRATQLNLRRDVAIKLLHPTLANYRDGRLRFIREAKVASALRHPNAVEIYDVGVDGPHIYIAMELLTGVVLRRLIEREPRLSLADSIEISGQIVDVLIAAHSLPLVHRDLKPDNIFIERDREGKLRVRVVDFGLAFIEGDKDNGRFTEEGVVMGTPAFIAPEQAMGVDVGPAADIYSLGCIMYQMLTRQLVFQGGSMSILTHHIYSVPPRMRDREPGIEISSDLDNLVLRMLAKRPEDRPCATSLVAALHSIKGTLAGQRHRGRGDRLLESRVARMVSVPDHPTPNIDPRAIQRTNANPELDLQVGVMGKLDDNLWFGLASNGLLPTPLAERDDARVSLCDAVLVVANDLDCISSLVQTGIPVVAILNSARVELVAELLQRGVSDALCSPIRVDELVRKLHRSIKRNRRKQKQ